MLAPGMSLTDGLSWPRGYAAGWTSLMRLGTAIRCT